MDLALYILQGYITIWICHKTQQTKPYLIETLLNTNCVHTVIRGGFFIKRRIKIREL